MRNIQTCENCSAENPFYQLICSKCRAYLRDRVVNIDLWDTVGKLIESPSATFLKIIFAEHKNFSILLTFLIAFKVFINSLLVLPYFKADSYLSNNLLAYFVFVIGLLFLMIYTLSIFLKFVTGISGIKARTMDNYAIIIYALVPYVFALIFLFPVELVLFGKYLFSANPSPFMLKPFASYVVLGIEVIIILWSLLLVLLGIHSFTRSKLFSIFSSIIIIIILNVLPFVLLIL